MDISKIFEAKFFQSKLFKIIPLIILILIVVILIFWAGMAIGFKKANFSCRWEENYHRNFAGPKNGFISEFRRDLGGQDFIQSNGTFGQIIKNETSSLVIKGPDNVEKIVLLTDDTIIKLQQQTVTPAELSINQYLVVIGEPNESGQLIAKFIRLLPPPPSLNQGRPIPNQNPDQGQLPNQSIGR